MRIALFPSTFFPTLGGVEIATHHLAARLRASGHFVVVVTWWGSWRKLPTRLPYAVRPLLPKTFWAKSLRQWTGFTYAARFADWQIASYQRLYHFDVWHSHVAFPSAALLSRVLPQIGTPYVVTCHGGDIVSLPHIQYGLRLNPHIDRAVQTALDKASAAIAVSSLMRSQLQELGVPECKIADIPNGVDSDFFTPETIIPRPCRQINRPLNILSVGRGDQVKNMLLVADIAEILRHRGVPFTWTVIGRDHHDLKQKIDSRKLSAHVIIRPEIAAMTPHGVTIGTGPHLLLREAYRQADVVVVPSLFESFSLVALEAMACGTPVLASSHCGCRDLICEGQNGWIANSISPEEFADKLELLHRGPPALWSPRDIASNIARDYSWDTIARKHEVLYSQLIGL